MKKSSKNQASPSPRDLVAFRERVIKTIDTAILEELNRMAPAFSVTEKKKEEPKSKDEKDKEGKEKSAGASKTSKPLPRELVQLRSIMKKHEKEYARIRLLNPMSNKLWQEMETLRGKNIPYDLVKKMTPSEAKNYIKQNPNDIMFLVSGDGHMVSATSTNKWIIIPDDDEEKEQVPGNKSSLIIFPMKQSKAGIWRERGGKKSVWDRARIAYVVEGELLKRL